MPNHIVTRRLLLVQLGVEEAVALARPGDIVLVAGKGHETGQEVRGVVHPFDDRVVVAEVLRARSGT